MPLKLPTFHLHSKLGLFGRSFALIFGLMLVSLFAWVQVFFSMEEAPRAREMAQRVTTTVSITRSALIYATEAMRPDLLLDLATKDSLRVLPRSPDDTLEPLPDSGYWNTVAREIKARLGQETQILWSVNHMPGVWVSFDMHNHALWLALDREQLGLTTGAEWLSWGLTALLLALIGAGISARFINRPLARISDVARQLARGETPSPLEEEGPAEIREMNTAFNRMARDIRQTEADRELMLAGISHDLRTPLARMRLEIELSQMNEEARQAIDGDLAQIDHTIGQLMEYARPPGALPTQVVEITSVLTELYERERMHTEAAGGKLSADIAPGLHARINPQNLRRIVSNLIENARRYGRSPHDGIPRIDLIAKQQGNVLVVEVKDRGMGIAESDIERLLRPFSRGETARTGVSGAGLGLAIVERLLAQAGGKLTLAPRPSGGLIARIEIAKMRNRDLPPPVV